MVNTCTGLYRDSQLRYIINMHSQFCLIVFWVHQKPEDLNIYSTCSYTGHERDAFLFDTAGGDWSCNSGGVLGYTQELDVSP